jgi:hypothetical protein
MLRKAKDVTVVEIIEDDVSRPAASLHVKDIVAWLSSHAVVASEQVPGECGDAAAQLDKSRLEIARRPCRDWYLWSFAASGMGFRRRDEASRQPLKPLFVAFALRTSATTVRFAISERQAIRLDRGEN